MSFNKKGIIIMISLALVAIVLLIYYLGFAYESHLPATASIGSSTSTISANIKNSTTLNTEDMTNGTIPIYRYSKLGNYSIIISRQNSTVIPINIPTRGFLEISYNISYEPNSSINSTFANELRSSYGLGEIQMALHQNSLYYPNLHTWATALYYPNELYFVYNNTYYLNNSYINYLNATLPKKLTFNVSYNFTTFSTSKNLSLKIGSTKHIFYKNYNYHIIIPGYKIEPCAGTNRCPPEGPDNINYTIKGLYDISFDSNYYGYIKIYNWSSEYQNVSISLYDSPLFTYSYNYTELGRFLDNSSNNLTIPIAPGNITIEIINKKDVNVPLNFNFNYTAYR